MDWKSTRFDSIHLNSRFGKAHIPAGGAIGILMTLWSLIQGMEFDGFVIFYHFIILLLFGYSIFCGKLCLNLNKTALKYSLINQLFQFIGFAFMGFAFKYVAGAFATIGLDLTFGFKINFNAGLSTVNLGADHDRLEVSFNLMALYLIYRINKLIEKAESDTLLIQTQ
jgi:hypothetical protein